MSQEASTKTFSSISQRLLWLRCQPRSGRDLSAVGPAAEARLLGFPLRRRRPQVLRRRHVLRAAGLTIPPQRDRLPRGGEDQEQGVRRCLRGGGGRRGGDLLQLCQRQPL